MSFFDEKIEIKTQEEFHQKVAYCLKILDISPETIGEIDNAGNFEQLINKSYKKNMLIFHPDKKITENPIFSQELLSAKTFLLDHSDELFETIQELNQELSRNYKNKVLSNSIRDYTIHFHKNISPWMNYYLPKNYFEKYQSTFSEVNSFLDFIDDNLMAESFKYIMKIKS